MRTLIPIILVLFLVSCASPVPPPASLQITTMSLPSATLNETYAVQLQASGGTAPYRWSVSGSLPKGVTLSSSGVLSGIPTESGSYQLTIQVSDSSSVTARMLIQINKRRNA